MPTRGLLAHYTHRALHHRHFNNIGAYAISLLHGHKTTKNTTNVICLFEYERMYLPLYKVSNTPFRIQGNGMSLDSYHIYVFINGACQIYLSETTVILTTTTLLWKAKRPYLLTCLLVKKQDTAF